MKARRNMIYLLAIVLLFLIGLIGLLYKNQDKLIFFPEILPEDYTFAFPYPFEEVSLEVEGGEKVYGLFFPAIGPSKGTVLYFHGNAGSLRTWGEVSQDFVLRGWDLLMTDYRGYGKSEARLSEKGMYEDAESWFDFLENRKGKRPEDILVYGRSIGTGVALELGLRRKPRHIILETPYTSMADLAREFYPFVPGWFLSYSLRSEDKIGKVSCPVSIFHGNEDEIVPFRQGAKLYEIGKLSGVTDIEFIEIEGGNHNNLSFFPKYQKELSAILDRIHSRRRVSGNQK